MEEIIHPPIAEILNYWFSVGTIAVFLLVAFFLGLYFVRKNYVIKLFDVPFAGTRAVMSKGLFVSIFALVVTMYYSEVLFYEACMLCWMARVFIYAQIPLFAVGMYLKDKKVYLYSMAMSGVGFVIALYHHMLQLGYSPYKPCSAAPFAVDCAKPSFVEFGFVTYPLMAVALFAFMMVYAWVSYKHSR